MSAATSESTSGTTTSGDTFGSPSDLSTTTTTTTTTESDSDQNTKHHSQGNIYFVNQTFVHFLKEHENKNCWKSVSNWFEL